MKVPLTASVVEGMDHAFIQYPHTLPEAEAEAQRIETWLREQSRRPLGSVTQAR